MWSVVVVVAEVVGEGVGAFGAGGVEACVGPFVDECLDEAFGFSVGLRASGAGVGVA